MNKLKRFLAVITAIVMFSANEPLGKHFSFIKSLNVYAEGLYDQQYTEGSTTFIYNKYNSDPMYQGGDYISIEGYVGTDSFVTIPDIIDGCPVRYVRLGRNTNGENDNSDLIISITLPDSVESLEHCPNLMQICGSSSGNAMRIAKSFGVAFKDIASIEPYGYLKYEENGNNITITGIDFSTNISDYTIPDQINGKQVTEIRIPSFYYDNNVFIPDQFTLKITNPDIIISESLCLDMWQHCSAIYASPGSNPQVFAYQNHIYYSPLEEESEESNESEYTFTYDTYGNENGEYIVIYGINGNNINEVVIPETINDIPVKELRLNRNFGKKITIPDTINYIDTYSSNKDTCFYVNNGSYACEYAKNNNIPYKYIGLPEEAYFRYNVSDYKLSVVGYRGTDTSITIPSKMYGMDVTGVGDRDPYGMQYADFADIKEITVPEKVDSFYVNTSLDVIYGYKGTAAESFAKEAHITFIALDEQSAALNRIKYALYDDHAEIISCEVNDTNNTYEIPSKVKGRAVTKILSGALKNMDYNYYVDIPSSVEYIANDVFIESNLITIRAEKGCYAIDYAKANNIRYEETEVPHDEYLSSCYRIETDYEGNEYVSINGLSESFIDGNDIIFPDRIEAIPVKSINATFNYQYRPFMSKPMAMYIPSSVTSINIGFIRESNSSDYSYGEPYSAITELPVSECISEIRGEPGSYAERYAKENNIPFKYIDKYISTTYINGSSYIYNGDYSYNTTYIVTYSDGYDVTIPERIGNKTINNIDISRLKYIRTLTVPENTNIYLSDNYCVIDEIKGYKGSQAESFANQRGIKFTPLPKMENGYVPEFTFSYENGPRLEKCDISVIDVMLPEECYYLNMEAFKGCTALKSIYIPDRVSYIPDTLFADCINLKEIRGSAGSAAEAYAISHNVSFIANQEAPRYILLGDYTPHEPYDNYPSYDVSIAGYDSNASKIVIPEKVYDDTYVKKISANAFYGYRGASTFEVPEFISEVETGAFANSCIQNIVLHKDIENVNNVFYNENDHSRSKSITVLNQDAIIANDITCKLICYYGSTAYEYAKEHNIPFEVILDDKVQSPDYLEYEVVYKYNDTYYSIEDMKDTYAFMEPYIRITHCNNIEEVEIPSTIGGIPVIDCTADAFNDCVSLKKLTVRANPFTLNMSDSIIQKIELISGYNNSSIMSLARDNSIIFNDLDNPVEYPAGIAFNISDDHVTISKKYSESSESSTWTTWTVPESMYGLPVTIVKFPFYTLKEIILPESVNHINLSGCPNIEKITINNNTCTFDFDKYSNNTLTDIYAPLENEFAFNYAAEHNITFHDINSDTVYSENTGFKYQIKDNAVIITGFSEDINEEQITDLVIPDTIYGLPVVRISDAAFYGCSSIKTVIIPESVTEIGYKAFFECPSLEKITINGSPVLNTDSSSPYSNDVIICDKNVMIQSGLYENITSYALKNGNPFCDLDGNVYPKPDNLKCYYKNNHVIISGMINDAEEYSIPESVYGIPVTEIDPYAFYYSQMIPKVVIPESVETIGENAFPNGTVIWGYTNTAAESYATDNKLEFVDIDIAEKNWDRMDWHWEDLDYNGIVTVELRSSDNEAFSRIINANVYIESSGDATCTEDGYIKYTAEVVIGGDSYSSSTTKILNATGHNYNVSEWIWSDDHSSCNAIFKCSDCDITTEPQNASVSLEDFVIPTCTEDGYNTYKADISYNGKEYTNSVTVPTNATGHNYVIDSWNWSEDRASCEVTIKCSSCNDVQVQTATVRHESLAPTCTVDGYDNYIAEITIGDTLYSEHNDKMLPATGHKNIVNKWIWSEDRKSCEAELKCSVCDEVIDTLQTTVRHEALEPTCTENGYDNYIAEITIDDTLYSDSNNKIIPAIGHDFYADSWTWSDDHMNCDVIVKCHNCDTVITDLYVSISSEVTKEPTYDETGTIVYTGVCEYANSVFNTSEEVEIPVKERTDISSAKVLISATSFDYDGTEKTVNVNSVKFNGVILTEGVDYVISGNTATESGDYNLTVTGIGAYKGTVSKYWKISRSFKVSYFVNGNRQSYIYTENAFCNVKAPIIDGKTFSHWKLIDSDTILSYNESYTFRVVSNTSVEAIYVDSGEEVVKEPVIAVTSVRAFNNKIYYEITRDIPEDYTVIANGILYGTSTSLFVDTDDENRDERLRFTDDTGSTTVKEKVHIGTSSINNNRGYYSYYLNIGENTDRPIYLRGYVIVKDNANNVHTLYTDIVGQTYNQILGN